MIASGPSVIEGTTGTILWTSSGTDARRLAESSYNGAIDGRIGEGGPYAYCGEHGRADAPGRDDPGRAGAARAYGELLWPSGGGRGRLAGGDVAGGRAGGGGGCRRGDCH